MHAFGIAIVALSISTAQAGKRLLAWPYYNGGADGLDPGKFKTGAGNTVAIYDWETYQPPSTNGAGGLEFIGTQASRDSPSSPIGQLATRQAAQGWTSVFTLNEPELNGITPAQAAEWYKKYIDPLPVKKALPAVTSSTSPGQGLDWLQQMADACGCNSCLAHYVNLHWYGNKFDDFQAHIVAAHNKFPQYQIVVTEFALTNPPGGQADQVAFYKQAFEFLDGAEYVALYAPYVATSPKLLQQHDPSAVSFVGTGSCLYNDDGSLSPVGQLML